MYWTDWLLGYLLLFYASAWDYVRTSPERDVIWSLCCVIIVWFIVTMIHMHKEAKRLRLRGSKMSRNVRKKWLQKHCADTIYAAFEAEVDAGHISQSEFTALVRMAKSRVGLPDLANRKKWGDVEVITPSKKTVNKDHLKAVKDGILLRTQWNIRNFLNKKPAIPGPPPGADIKSQPLRKRGALLSRRPRSA